MYKEERYTKYHPDGTSEESVKIENHGTGVGELCSVMACIALLGITASLVLNNGHRGMDSSLPQSQENVRGYSR
jgi:hypothetical protein